MSEELDRAMTAVVGERPAERAAAVLGALLQSGQYVAEVVSIAYETAKIQIHDHERRKVGGIPALSFLVASRLSPPLATVDPGEEDSSVILLRVMDATELPNSREAEGVRVETARSVSGEIDRHWDSDSAMDADTRMLLGYAGVRCRILGTFFLEADDDAPDGFALRFGSDISNYYPNRGLKVYRPVDDALETIVNYVRSADLMEMPSTMNVPLGEVRYASTHRTGQRVNVPVRIYPADLLTQKTAVFGMTRTGKSNTVKIIAQSVYDLRGKEKAGTAGASLRIGQLVFDPDGEYANQNVQDAGALKNIWKPSGRPQGEEVTTYGVVGHPNDPERKLMRLNFYRDGDLQTGKEIIDDLISGDSAKYVSNFRDVQFEELPEDDHSARVRHDRRVLAYRTLLHKAGFKPSESFAPRTRSSSGKPLFSKKLIEAMKNSPDTERNSDYARSAGVLESARPTWPQLEEAMKILRDFIHDRKKSGYQEFNEEYAASSSTGAWADDILLKVLEMFNYPNGSRAVGKALPYHSGTVSSDFADDVYEDLVRGKLVVIDQSTGDPQLNQESADRIMWKVFRGNQQLFREGKKPPHVLVYVEEAHNQLPSERDADLANVWVRTAKEGAKFNIGMVYATQEVSTIQRNILKNTANWFIGHLNNTDETRELRKYYDFADFEQSILRAQDKGFLRVKTLSNPFVVPVQVRRFSVRGE